MTINSPTITKNIMDNVKYPISTQQNAADVWCFATETGACTPTVQNTRVAAGGSVTTIDDGGVFSGCACAEPLGAWPDLAADTQAVFVSEMSVEVLAESLFPPQHLIQNLFVKLN